MPLKNASELIAYSNPGKLNYASATSTGIMAATQLAIYAKLGLVRVPYKGEAPATIDLVSGQVQMMFATPTNAGGPAKEGRLKVLATLLLAATCCRTCRPCPRPAHRKSSSSLGRRFRYPAKFTARVFARVNHELNNVLARPETRADRAPIV